MQSRYPDWNSGAQGNHFNLFLTNICSRNTENARGAPKRWELMYPKKYIRQVEQVSIQDSQCLGVGMSDWQYDSE